MKLVLAKKRKGVKSAPPLSKATRSVSKRRSTSRRRK